MTKQSSRVYLILIISKMFYPKKYALDKQIDDTKYYCKSEIRIFNKYRFGFNMKILF